MVSASPCSPHHGWMTGQCFFPVQFPSSKIPRDTQRVSQEGEKALKNEQKRQKSGYLRENSLFADVGRSGSKGSHLVQSHLAGIRKCVTEPPLKNRPRRHIPCWAQCCSRPEHE